MTPSSGDKSPLLYSFKTEEEPCVRQLVLAVRALLRRPELPAQDVVIAGILLRSLERLPLVTTGIGIALQVGQNLEDGSSGYYALTIDEEFVSFSSGEVIYSPAVGSDHESRDIIEIGVGWREGDADYIELEDWAAAFRYFAEKPDGSIHFDDYAESEVDWHDERKGDYYWQQLESDFA
jgi:hypothetical protein